MGVFLFFAGIPILRVPHTQFARLTDIEALPRRLVWQESVPIGSFSSKIADFCRLLLTIAMCYDIIAADITGVQHRSSHRRRKIK